MGWTEVSRQVRFTSGWGYRAFVSCHLSRGEDFRVFDNLGIGLG